MPGPAARGQRLGGALGLEATPRNNAAALTHEARQQREAEVMGNLLAAERDESTLILTRRRKVCAWCRAPRGACDQLRRSCPPRRVGHIRAGYSGDAEDGGTASPM